MTAAMNDVDEETLKSLHVMCVTEVRKINGIIDYEDAVEYQREKKLRVLSQTLLLRKYVIKCY